MGNENSSEGDSYEKWGSMDLANIQEGAGYVYGKENTQLCDRNVANQMAQKLLKHPDQINSSSVAEVLNMWIFAKKYLEEKRPGRRTGIRIQ